MKDKQVSSGAIELLWKSLTKCEKRLIDVLIEFDVLSRCELIVLSREEETSVDSAIHALQKREAISEIFVDPNPARRQNNADEPLYVSRREFFGLLKTRRFSKHCRLINNVGPALFSDKKPPLKTIAMSVAACFMVETLRETRCIGALYNAFKRARVSGYISGLEMSTDLGFPSAIAPDLLWVLSMRLVLLSPIDSKPASIYRFKTSHVSIS